MAQCFLFEATFPAFHGSYCKPQVQEDWAQASRHGGWISPALGTSLGHTEPFWTSHAWAVLHVLPEQPHAHRRAIPSLWGVHCRELLRPTPAQRVLCLSHRDLGRSWARILWQKMSRSFCIVWLSSDHVNPEEMPYHAPVAPIPARCWGDSHRLPVQDLFELVWFKYLLTVNFEAGIRNSANTSLKNKIKKPHTTLPSLNTQLKRQ